MFDALPDLMIEPLVRATETRVGPYCARMSPKAREATLRRAVAATIRERLDLPRLSLFTISR